MVRKFLISIFCLLLIFSLPINLYAADGIGFSQAEEGTWFCLGDNPVTTLNCARDKCRREAQGQDCYRTKWCFGNGWSGLMSVFLSDFHTTQILCGAPSKEALFAALKEYCKGNNLATSCSIFLTIDPSGREQEVQEDEIEGPAEN